MTLCLLKKEKKYISSKRDIFIHTSKRASYLITLWNSNNIIINNNKIVINNDIMREERKYRCYVSRERHSIKYNNTSRLSYNTYNTRYVMQRVYSRLLVMSV